MELSFTRGSGEKYIDRVRELLFQAKCISEEDTIAGLRFFAADFILGLPFELRARVMSTFKSSIRVKTMDELQDLFTVT